eukprot:TRINITY_DN572_c0_g3_i2.p1 TRINITY_DN572_c0_g3~~TRINITY_DN572_c0_g3_i2.p1  ORF type:complete len:214 (+),score=45.02 TRINITY_DN572_c0_g3_i2:156-797(+)
MSTSSASVTRMASSSKVSLDRKVTMDRKVTLDRKPTFERKITSNKKPEIDRKKSVLETVSPEKLIQRGSQAEKRLQGLKVDVSDGGLNEKELTLLWDFYDVNHDNQLDEKEITKLATDILDRIPVMFRTMLSKQFPKMGKSDLDKMVLDELPHILPGTKAQTVKFLMKNLNIDNDKTITKNEFKYKWNACAKLLFSGLDETLAQKGGLQCTIL